MPATNRRPLDPRKCNIAIDANALDRDGTNRDCLVDRFNKLSSEGQIRVVLAGGVRSEIQHPRTPDDVRAAFAPQIFNLQPGLNSSQWDTRRRVQAILQGNAKPDKHKADASHLSEAAETGCAYFITHDKRILDKSLELATVLPPTLTIVTLAEFMEIFDGYAGVDG